MVKHSQLHLLVHELSLPARLHLQGRFDHKSYQLPLHAKVDNQLSLEDPNGCGSNKLLQIPELDVFSREFHALLECWRTLEESIRVWELSEMRFRRHQGN